MRKWLLAGVVLLLLCGALALYYMDSRVASKKNYLLERAQQMSGRKVSVGTAQMTLFSGPGLRLNHLVLSDDPAYSSDEFLRADHVQLNFQLLPLLLGQVRIKRLILHNAVITMVRNAAGAYNFSTFGRADKEKKGEFRGEEKGQSPAANALSWAIPSSSLDVSNGTMRYRDLADGSDLTIRRVDLKVTGLEYDAPFTVEFVAAIFAPEQNLELNTVVGPVSPHGDFADVPLHGQIRVHALDMGKVRAAVPRLRKTLPKLLDVRGIYTIENLEFKGTLNKPWLKGAVEGTDASFRFE